MTAIEIADPREAELPDVGQLVLVDPETGDIVEADTALAAASAPPSPRPRPSAAPRVAAAIRRARAHHVILSTDGDWLRELARGAAMSLARPASTCSALLALPAGGRAPTRVAPRAGGAASPCASRPRRCSPSMPPAAAAARAPGRPARRRGRVLAVAARQAAGHGRRAGREGLGRARHRRVGLDVGDRRRPVAAGRRPLGGRDASSTACRTSCWSASSAYSSQTNAVVEPTLDRDRSSPRSQPCRPTAAPPPATR